MVNDLANLNEEILQLNAKLCDLEVKNKTYHSKSLFGELTNNIDFELIDEEAMSFSANELNGLINEAIPNAVGDRDMSKQPSEEPVSFCYNDRIPIQGFSEYEMVDRGDFLDLYYKGVGPYRINPNPTVSSDHTIKTPVYVASGDVFFDKKFLERFLKNEFHLSNLPINQLSVSNQATYKSFRIDVPTERVDEVLQLRKWPKNIYVRRFEVSKKQENFQIANWKNRKIKNRAVWNPTSLL